MKLHNTTRSTGRDGTPTVGGIIARLQSMRERLRPAIRSDVPREMKDDLREPFLNMHEDNPDVFREVARGNSPGYVEVDHEVYQITVDLRQELADERRNRR